ncbi:MAG: hypothetical protein J5847_00195 [Clostridia bacterium]|nr:hypothetical protein [Clostridia bacterium]MBR5753810.1 hypothetical protein [Clostridia bacterium]
MKMTIEELLQTQYWVIDILPSQVSNRAAGQYFAVDEFWGQEPNRSAIKQKQVNVILKLNCYRDIALEDEANVNPPVQKIADSMFAEHTNLLVGDALIVSDPEDTYITVYNPDAKLLDLVRKLAMAEGLFVWQPKGLE